MRVVAILAAGFVLSLGLAGCAVVEAGGAVIGAGASVVGAAADVTGDAVGAVTGGSSDHKDR
jgi:hypothetical protein